MATSVLTAATDHHQTTNTSSLQSSLPQDHHDHHTVRRSSGRRKTKGGGDSASSGQKIKKQPQRGMGVEKLERIRLSKRWEKMTETNAAAIHGGFGINATAAQFSDPALFGGAAASVLPFHLSKIAGYGAPVAGQMGFNPNQNQSNYLGFHGQTGFLVPNYKELSSSPSPNAVLNCYSDHCNACHKKKKVLNNEINLGSGRVMTRSEMYMQSCNVGDYGFLGLNIGDNNSQNITNQETQCQKGTKAPSPFAPQLSYAVGNSKQGTIDVVAVHRRGSTNSEGVNLMMEYEFFPSEKSFCISDDDELVMKMVGRGSETTTTNSSSSSYYSSSTMAGFDALNQVDLSLKLSY